MKKHFIYKDEFQLKNRQVSANSVIICMNMQLCQILSSGNIFPKRKQNRMNAVYSFLARGDGW